MHAEGRKDLIDFNQAIKLFAGMLGKSPFPKSERHKVEANSNQCVGQGWAYMKATHQRLAPKGPGGEDPADQSYAPKPGNMRLRETNKGIDSQKDPWVSTNRKL